MTSQKRYEISEQQREHFGGFVLSVIFLGAAMMVAAAWVAWGITGAIACCGASLFVFGLVMGTINEFK